ncbi:MAG: septum formation initiator family protein [Succinivibrio sp.]|nr:septum formation initiator family protein [Succinivibrio sp.]
MKIFALLLVIAIGFLSYDIMYGRNGIAQYDKISVQVEKAKHKSDLLKKRNQALLDEISDLKQGNLTIEELARSELGMIKPEETFYRVIKAN